MMESPFEVLREVKLGAPRTMPDPIMLMMVARWREAEALGLTWRPVRGEPPEPRTFS